MFALPRNSPLRALRATLDVLRASRRQASKGSPDCNLVRKCPPKSCLNPPDLCNQPHLEVPPSGSPLGGKYLKVFMSFLPSLARYGLIAIIAITYIADWKAILQYLPYYNGKYYDPDEEGRAKRAAAKQAAEAAAAAVVSKPEC